MNTGYRESGAVAPIVLSTRKSVFHVPNFIAARN